MNFLIFLGALIGGAIILLGVMRVMSESRSGPVVPMVRIGIAENDLQADMWAQRLRQTDVVFTIRGYSGSPVAGGRWYPNSFNTELWVRAEDAQEARELLGLVEE